MFVYSRLIPPITKKDTNKDIVNLHQTEMTIQNAESNMAQKQWTHQLGSTFLVWVWLLFIFIPPIFWILGWPELPKPFLTGTRDSPAFSSGDAESVGDSDTSGLMVPGESQKGPDNPQPEAAGGEGKKSSYFFVLIMLRVNYMSDSGLTVSRTPLQEKERKGRMLLLLGPCLPLTRTKSKRQTNPALPLTPGFEGHKMTDFGYFLA